MPKFTFVLGLLAVVAIKSVTPRASTATVGVCNGNFVKWPSATVMKRDLCSMPSGSAEAAAYDAAATGWSRYTSIMNFNSTYNAGCTIAHGNGVNEVARVARSHISGAHGLTTLKIDKCAWPAWNHDILEADVEMASDMLYPVEDHSFWNFSHGNQGRAVLLHEFGHALGLKHDEVFNMMRTTTPLPLTGWNRAQPLGDDAFGVGLLYVRPAGSGTNLFASTQKLLNNTIVATTSTQAGNPSHNCVTFSGPGFCRGQTIGFDATFGNNGTSARTANARIYMNNSPSPGAGWNMWTGSVTVSGSNQFTSLFWVPIPTSVPNGLYWILWQVDSNSALAEFDETDNTVHTCMTLNITC